MRYSNLAAASTVILMLLSSSVNAGILWGCTIEGKVRSEPQLIDGKWHLRFEGTSFEMQKNNFCRDWLNREGEITLTEKYYTKLGRPGHGDTVVLHEVKEENDYGHGLMQWRYFDRGFQD